MLITKKDVGRRVKTDIDGEGVIQGFNVVFTYPVEVKFDKGHQDVFTKEGYQDKNNKLETFKLEFIEEEKENDY